jgi:predicted nucleic acid-binding protein
MSLVLDSSATLAWIFADEASGASRRILALVSRSGAIVPALWRLEIASVLTVEVRRGRITAGGRQSALDTLARLDIAIDPDTDTHVWAETLMLADRFGLTIYDATYLELAQRRTLPLATFDAKLRDAALALGLQVLGSDNP